MFRWLACLIHGCGHVEFIEGLNESWIQPNQLSLQVASRADNLIRHFLETDETYWRDREKTASRWRSKTPSGSLLTRSVSQNSKRKLQRND
jgi:hypothetical protein